jgi:hypothetical protein
MSHAAMPQKEFLLGQLATHQNTGLKPAEIRRRKSAILSGVLGRLLFPNWFDGSGEVC